MARRTRVSRKQKGRGYGFGGSILENAGGSNAGNALWNKNMGSDCGVSAAEQSRGGNNTMAGGRRKKRHGRKHTRKHGRRGGGSILALQQPRAGYTFDGSGIAGTKDPVPQPAYTTYV
jgi:hypothetical protein